MDVISPPGELYREALEASPNGVMITTGSEDGYRLIYTNTSFERITGYPGKDILGRNPRFLHAQDDQQPDLLKLRTALACNEPASVVLRNYRQDGSLFWNELHVAPLCLSGSSTCHYVGIINDITSHRHYEQQLEYQSNHDQLTGLPNRFLLRDRLHQALARAQRREQMVAILHVNLDQLGQINDSFGHASGDALLMETARRLRQSLRAEDTLARVSGDEFVILLSDMNNPDDSAVAADRSLKIISMPYRFQSQDLQITASIGISVYPRDGENSEILLRNAGAALRRVKGETRNHFYFFRAEMNTDALKRVTMETHLRRAMENNELTLHYQPQVDLRTGRIIAAEALLRWTNESLGTLSPDQFIPVAEDSELIVPIGNWVLETACKQAVRWQKSGLPPVTLSVNLSAKQLLHPGIETMVRDVLSQTGLSPELLELELTETTVMMDPVTMLERLLRLKEIGVMLSIDDFGTGYSSLSHLQRFPFDKLKIDRSFMSNLISDPHNAALVQAIIVMAGSLKLRTIAEGVETEGQLNFLRRHYCDQIQGFYFSRPLPPEEFEAMLASGKELPRNENESQRPTLLIIDDEPNVTRALQRELRGEEYRVITVNNPLDAFEVMAREQIQVVLSDQRMPQMNGTELLRRLREIYPDTVRLVLSGYTDLKTITDAINDGHIYKFLTKPWDDAELCTILREAFRHYEEKSPSMSLQQRLGE